jgi:hypothetical protein
MMELNMASVKPEFDLQPDPRILPMLGEINLLQWRCLAELIDNSIDGFLQAKREGEHIDNPEVRISTPIQDTESAKITVRDNGPGMMPETLERAVRAGWSGNNPIDSLGMFGMGFNIATARLGTATTVWTTRKHDREWHGLRIDFEELRNQGHFRTPHLTRPKIDPYEQGTEVTIDRLKPEQRQWFTRASNRSRVGRELSATYSAILRPNSTPISFSLYLNGPRLLGKNHCIWNPRRVVETGRHGPVSALQVVDTRLDDRLYCLNCWQWIPAQQEECPGCGKNGKVTTRQRHVHGWLGIQRYLHSSDFGIDFIRNGRKLEIANKELFSWRGNDNEEPEYPIDDPRNRGRIVGEIHLDHCRVTYTKDRFDRNDPAWEEMVRIVRGDGPLRPDTARELGYGTNYSPLSLLFQAFRRSSPKPKVAGCWAKILVVRDNERAEQMAKKFYAGEPEYQDDFRWWELVEEEDRKLLVTSSGPTRADDPVLEGFGAEEGGEEAPPNSYTTPASPTPKREEVHPNRSPIASLTTEYRHDITDLRWNVIAWSVEPSDPQLPSSTTPWKLIATIAGDFHFYVNESHEVFRSATMTPLDALLSELAWAAMDFLRDRAPQGVSFASVLSELRQKYASITHLDPISLASEARLALSSIARNLPSNIEAGDGGVFFSELPPSDQDAVLQRMAVRDVSNPQEAISSGRFLEYAPRKTILTFFSRHPEFFFDGKYWEAAYTELDFGREAATDEARSRLVRYYENLLSDAIWLSEQEPADLALAGRARVLRAALALDLLEPAVQSEEGR